MTTKELETSFNQGRILMKGRYWSGRIDTISVRGKVEGGPRRSAYIAREVIAADDDMVIVSRFLRDDEDHVAWKPSAKKNDLVVVLINGMTLENGTRVLQGFIEPLT